ncbi:MAG: hypothetical protein ACK5GN_03205 [Pseudomonadota bacterium]|jgi:3-oxoacyl-[acyl-carrier-protein] synthase III
MNILGIATASPSIVVAGDEAQECAVRSSPLAVRAGVRSKRISLPLDYIRETGNSDILEAWKVATTSPTALGAQAVRALLAQKGIAIEQVGLVLADTGTPYQTCPSEAQRIVGELGAKISAFDVVGGIGAVPHLFSVISRWSAERTPEYLIYVSTNTPSQHVAYRLDPNSAGLFGDAAVALLLARQHQSAARSMRVAYCGFRPESNRRSPIVIEQTIRINEEALLSSQQLQGYITSELDILKCFDPKIAEKALFVAPQLYASEVAEILGRHGVRDLQIVSGVEEIGFALGSSHGVALSRVWCDIEPGRAVVLMHCGDGQCGSVVLIAS